ncbi:MAG: serine/threonine protein kinase [Propionibacteriaceae bacterium]|nr:serine/threonine protein kinase [Propionibacteriaceae bacterium]
MSEAASATPPEIPGFTFIRELGRGGFADVFLYSQITPRREVAVKVLHADMAGSESAARLNKEADAMAGLSGHQNIITVFSSGVAVDGRPYLVMEYYPGAALAQGLRKTQWSLTNVLKIGIQLAGALESAHCYEIPGGGTQGILHRDVKPANILMDRWGRPVLGDFGIAMTNAEAAEGKAQGMSIPWSPPEAFDKNPVPTRQSDIWSLAATIYALLTGRAPFEVLGGDNKAHAMIDRIRHEPYRPLGRVDTPDSLDQILSTAMAKLPTARYPSMRAFGMALRQVEAELDLPPTQMDILEDSGSQRIEDEDGDAGGTELRPLKMINPSLPIISDSVQTHESLGIFDRPAPQIQPGAYDEVVLAPTQVRPLALTPMEDTTDVDTSVQPPKDKSAPLWKTFLILGIIVAIVVLVVVVIYVRDPEGNYEPTPSPPTSASKQTPQGDIDIPLSPTEISGEVNLEESVIVFTWTNPDPHEGDKYQYTVDPPGETHTTSVTTVTVPIPESTKIMCIKVRVIRNGSGSELEQACEVV